MCRQILECDGAPITLWHLYGFWQVFSYRVIEQDLPMLSHVSQEQRGEHLGRRTNLKDRITVQRPKVTLRKVSVFHSMPPFRGDHPHDDPDALVLGLNSFDKDFSNLLVRK